MLARDTMPRQQRLTTRRADAGLRDRRSALRQERSQRHSCCAETAAGLFQCWVVSTNKHCAACEGSSSSRRRSARDARLARARDESLRERNITRGVPDERAILHNDQYEAEDDRLREGAGRVLGRQMWGVRRGTR